MPSKFSGKAKKPKKPKGGRKITPSQAGSIDWGDSAAKGADRYGGYIPRPR